MELVNASRSVGPVGPIDAIVALLAKTIASDGWAFVARDRDGEMVVLSEESCPRTDRWWSTLALLGTGELSFHAAAARLNVDVVPSSVALPLGAGAQTSALVSFERRACPYRASERAQLARAVSVVAPWLAVCDAPHAVYVLDRARRPRAWWITDALDEPLANRLAPCDASLPPAVELCVDAALRGVAFGLPEHPWVRVDAIALEADDPSPVIVAVGRDRRRERIVASARKFGLSSREVDVVHRLLLGEDTAAIGRTLGIGSHTVRDHLKSALRKTSAPNRVALAARVLGYHAPEDLPA